MRIALYEPDIAANVGAILRTATCLGVPVDLIEPMGFPWSRQAMARSGMDYADAAEVTRHVDWAAFEASARGRIVLLTTKGATPLWDTQFREDDVLLLGSEGRGVPETVHARADLRLVIPMRPGFRSLNIGVSAAMVLGEALRQTRHAAGS
ncbi:tRNA (cytidine(34)-2'-O)-methyltransferase [Sphingomonas sp. R86521]|uniref:tRNA (cytidine(34)-2'-O)-methyltransferase n=1 Tax=Sphingomonas sp. R86521 TaxID=3093860 RepID=UPI0036D349FC